MKQLILFLVGCLSTAFVTAQDVRKVAFRTLCLERKTGMEMIVMPGNNPAESQKFELFTDISPLVEGFFRDNEATFFIEKPGPDGKPLRELVGKTTLGNSDKQLFVFVPGETGKGDLPYNVRNFDDDTKAFPMGSIRAINMAPVPIRFVLSGDVTPEIPASKYAQFPHAKKVNDYNMYPVVVEFLSGNGKWVSGQSVSWKATERRREVVITMVDQKYKQPVVRMYSDFPPWLEAPVTPAR